MFPQDVDWAEHDSHNRPLGFSCWDCGDVCKKLRPDWTIEQSQEEYQKGGDFQSMMDVAADLQASLDEKDKARFTPGTHVTHDNYFGFELYQEFAAVTASEYQALGGVHPSTIQNKVPFPMKWAGPSSQPQSLYLLGLEGMTPDQIAGVRKVRLRFCNGVVSSDEYLNPQIQLDSAQPSFVLDHVFGKFVTQRPQNPIGAAPESVQSLRAMLEKEKQQTAFQGQADDSDDGWAESEEEGKRKGPRRAAPGYGEGTCAPAKVPKKTNKGKPAKQRVEPGKDKDLHSALGEPVEEGDSATGKASSLGRKLLKCNIDPELLGVASKVTGATKCLENLTAETLTATGENKYALSAKLRGVPSSASGD